VKSAYALNSKGIKTFVVGFSNAVTDSYTSTTLNNIALLPDVYSASLVFHALDATA